MFQSIKSLFLWQTPSVVPTFPDVDVKCMQAQAENNLSTKVSLFCEAARSLPPTQLNRAYKIWEYSARNAALFLSDEHGESLKGRVSPSTDEEMMNAICEVVQTRMHMPPVVHEPGYFGSGYAICDDLETATMYLENYISLEKQRFGSDPYFPQLHSGFAQKYIKLAKLYQNSIQWAATASNPEDANFALAKTQGALGKALDCLQRALSHAKQEPRAHESLQAMLQIASLAADLHDRNGPFSTSDTDSGNSPILPESSGRETSSSSKKKIGNCSAIPGMPPPVEISVIPWKHLSAERALIFTLRAVFQQDRFESLLTKEHQIHMLVAFAKLFPISHHQSALRVCDRIITLVGGLTEPLSLMVQEDLRFVDEIRQTH